MASRMWAGRRIVLLVAGVLFFYAGWNFWAETERAAGSLASFQWLVLIPVLLLSGVNYSLRALRWEYYLRLLSIRLPLLKSMAIFLASLLFCITPGRLGEVCKSYFVHKVNGTPVARTVPIVLAERVVDVLATGALALAGLLSFDLGWKVLAAAGLLASGVVIVLGSKRHAHAVFAWLGRLPRLGRFVPHVKEMYDGAHSLMRPAPLAVSLAISVPAWFTECLGCYLVLLGLGVKVPLLGVTAAYTLATLAGAVSMLPGGLGATEGSLAVLLVGMGVSPTTAVAATFITRACTLWFAVGLGALALFLNNKEFCDARPLTAVIDDARRVAGPPPKLRHP
ncbi:MAG: lysylphosphatidylglycerol synthase transmembrane domain-containing protein [Pseudomonadota bacterium]